MEVNFKLLHKHKHKLCPCLNGNIEANNIKENICPCDALTLKGECRCGIFKKRM